MWRSLVARFAGGEEVAGSNPVIPTTAFFFFFPSKKRQSAQVRSLPDDLNTNLALPKTLPLLGLLLFLLTLAGMVSWQNLGRTNPAFDLFKAIPHYDKVGHFFLMGLLSFLAVSAVTSTAKEITRRRIYATILLVALLVAVEEASQMFIASRTFSLADLICSWLGVALFGALAAFKSSPSQSDSST